MRSHSLNSVLWRDGMTCRATPCVATWPGNISMNQVFFFFFFLSLKMVNWFTSTLQNYLWIPAPKQSLQRRLKGQWRFTSSKRCRSLSESSGWAWRACESESATALITLFTDKKNAHSLSICEPTCCANLNVCAFTVCACAWAILCGCCSSC